MYTYILGGRGREILYIYTVREKEGWREGECEREREGWREGKRER